VGAGAWACGGDRRAPFGLGLDGGQGGRDRLLPATGDQFTPPLSDSPEVGADLPLVGQQRATGGLLGEHERLHDMGDGAADQPEVDPLGPGEPDRLDRLGDQAEPPAERGEVAARTMSLPRSSALSLSASARGARPR
jgi:hypothetical protein